jgi:glutathione S-transferase
MLTIHHLERSASERIVWLLEELEHPYRLVRYRREPGFMAPPEYKALHPIGASPVIEDDGLVLAESGAIVQYLLARHDRGRLAIAPGDPRFASYLYWFHFANGTLQPALVRALLLRTLELEPTTGIARNLALRLRAALGHIDSTLGQSPYFAGDHFSAADIMMVFSLTTMRLYQPIDLAPYPHILAYLPHIGARPAYRRAMAAADPDLAPVLS